MNVAITWFFLGFKATELEMTCRFQTCSEYEVRGWCFSHVRSRSQSKRVHRGSGGSQTKTRRGLDAEYAQHQHESFVPFTTAVACRSIRNVRSTLCVRVLHSLFGKASRYVFGIMCSCQFQAQAVDRSRKT